MNITHILLNNNQLGKITKEQRAAEWNVWQTSLHNPDFAEFARLCGTFGARVTNKSRLDKTIGRALKHDETALVANLSDPDLIQIRVSFARSVALENLGLPLSSYCCLRRGVALRRPGDGTELFSYKCPDTQSSFKTGYTATPGGRGNLDADQLELTEVVPELGCLVVNLSPNFLVGAGTPSKMIFIPYSGGSIFTSR